MTPQLQWWTWPVFGAEMVLFGIIIAFDVYRFAKRRHPLSLLNAMLAAGWPIALMRELRITTNRLAGPLLFTGGIVALIVVAFILQTIFAPRDYRRH